MTAVPVDSLEAAAYTVPTDAPEADGTLEWTSTTMVLVTVTAAGVVGHGWTYGPRACSAVVGDTLAAEVTGRDAYDVSGSYRAMTRAVRNQGRPGIAEYAISAVDVALWDLKARLLDLPLHRLLGTVEPDVPVYASGGFTSYDTDQLDRQLTEWVDDGGFDQVKIKIAGKRGGELHRDPDRLTQARRTIGDDIALFADANGGYTAKQAIQVGRAAAHLGLAWFEEPVPSDYLSQLNLVRTALDTEVAAGEYGWDVHYFRRMCAAGAVDCLQADATRCGGITGFLHAAVVADSFGLDLSAHCAPQIHAQAAASILNLRHLEWFHDHVRIERLFFDGCLDPDGGAVRPRADRPGLGVDFRSRDAEPYRVV